MASANGPLSLYQYACNVAVKFASAIEDVGDIEYRVVAPVLKKITSPLQLRNLEARSPQLAGDDAELWKKFIARDFGTDSVDKWVPKNPKNWSRIYDKHQREAERAHERAANALKTEFENLNSTKEGLKTQVLDPKLCPPLRRSRWGGGGGGGGSSWGQTLNTWDSKVGSKTKNIIQKARREAKEISRRNGMSRTTVQPAAGVASEELKRKIRAVEKMRLGQEEPPAEGKRRGDDGNGWNKRRRTDPMGDDDGDDDDGDDGDEAEHERLAKAEEWKRKASEKRTVVAQGPRARILPGKKAADPFFRPKKSERGA